MTISEAPHPYGVSLELPVFRSAVLLRQVFDPTSLEQLEAERATGEWYRDIPTNPHHPEKTSDVLDRLSDTNLPSMRHWLSLLSKMVERAGISSPYFLSEFKCKPDFPAHHDGYPDLALSFLVVTSGQIDYRLGGFSFYRRHYGFRQFTAFMGDVLCLDNRPQKSRKRPLHSGANGAGSKRLTFDFFYDLNATSI